MTRRVGTQSDSGPDLASEELRREKQDEALEQIVDDCDSLIRAFYNAGNGRMLKALTDLENHLILHKRIGLFDAAHRHDRDA